MSWRVVVISNRCKLEYKLGYLVCRGEETKQVHISEIATLIVESTAVSLTAALLSELIARKVNVVFCDDKHNPQSQLLALHGRHDCSGYLRRQIAWDPSRTRAVWDEIIRQKIWQQYLFLQELGLVQADMLYGYWSDVRDGDSSNREGHAAKVYFNALFGLEHKRWDNTFVNQALNYGYSILLSAFNREIVACGYNTQLGIAHKSEFNAFNLACDLMEPFRVLVDRFVLGKETELTPAYKHALCNILNQSVTIDGESCTVSAAIGTYCRSVWQALDSGDVLMIKQYAV